MLFLFKSSKLSDFVESTEDKEAKLHDYDEKLIKIETNFDELKTLINLFITKTTEACKENFIFNFLVITYF